MGAGRRCCSFFSYTEHIYWAYRTYPTYCGYYIDAYLYVYVLNKRKKKKKKKKGSNKRLAYAFWFSPLRVHEDAVFRCCEEVYHEKDDRYWRSHRINCVCCRIVIRDHRKCLSMNEVVFYVPSSCQRLCPTYVRVLYWTEKYGNLFFFFLRRE